MAKQVVKQDFTFFDQLWNFYATNRKEIKSQYNDLTRKFLTYNDWNDNRHKAFLRKPQYEALEMYVFIKEVMHNKQIYEIFDDWRKDRGQFSEKTNTLLHKNGTISLFDEEITENTELLFQDMKKYKESYPNYIYALAMGLGKTVLMATCIFYEFLLANKYPKNKLYCHNALVFAPDKTVLESLREIMTFDKKLVVPEEYVHILDENIKFHYLDDASTTLGTIDDSDFNIIISNTQKIIVKKKRKESTATDKLFNDIDLLADVYGDEIADDGSLMMNQRFEKICRLPRLGVYVDEAHHLFGADLEKQLRATTAEKTSLRDTINLFADNTSIVACYNFTGTPYVNNRVLPEVIYSYGLRQAILNNYLKDANIKGYENVKSSDFVKEVVDRFWERYGGKKYEGLNPKLAFFATTIDEAVEELRPALEETLSEKGISINKVLVNVGDTVITKSEDIYNFNNLDVVGSEGDNKQFIILVGKGREGWNCRSLFGVAFYRSPKSKILVLQASMRCLRSITDQQQTASIFLSNDNYKILDDELNKNFDMSISDMKNAGNSNKKQFEVRVVPPLRTIKLKRVRYKYSLLEKEYNSNEPISFELDNLDLEKYEARVIEKESIGHKTVVKVKTDNGIVTQNEYSNYSIVGEIARYMNASCLLIDRMLQESKEGIEKVVDFVNKYNQILDDVIIPKMFHTLYEIATEKQEEESEIVLLREPKDAAFYLYTSTDDLTIAKGTKDLSDSEKAKTFHADTYCFDSIPERELFNQYVRSDKVEELYFTGMFTAHEGDLYVQYYDPESQRIRAYYPDFLAKMKDGSYQLIEVKGDNKIDDVVVQAKAEAAKDLAEASNIEYIMLAGSTIVSGNVLKD